ncbi:unnamed protein product [Linum trigynum]|uniref:ARM repeat superfamily protein n=1 Tax=Linum trigynum TaxID=586398 RepID=A0AAV2EGF5_9ROSI
MEVEEERRLLWKSELQPESMLSVTVGRAMSTLLAARCRKLRDSISTLSLETLKKPSSLGSLEEQLVFLHTYVKDAAEKDEKLDDVLIPIIQHSLANKDLKRGGQALVLINWLFQDEFVFQAVAKNMVDVIKAKDDRFICLGWCVLVRSLVEYENFMDQYSLYGIRDNYQPLLDILCLCLPHLSKIVTAGSILRDGFELPTRLSVSAADCILAISKALTIKAKVSSTKSQLLTMNASSQSMTPQSTDTAVKKVKLASKSSEGSMTEMSYLLWDQMDILILLLQKLLAWSRKSRVLHAKGVELVLKWMQEIKQRYRDIRNEADALKSGTLLLSSCWKHFGGLLYLEDHNFYQKCDELLEQYSSGIQYYMENQAEDHGEKTTSGLETRKFFITCLCLLLGRLDGKRFESSMSEHWVKISRILISQLHCTDEDVVSGAVCILKAAIFKNDCSSGNALDNKQMNMMFPQLLNLLDERDSTAKAIVMLIAEYCSMSTGGHCLEQILQRLASENAKQRRNAIDVISELIHLLSNSIDKLPSVAWQDIANSLLERLSDEETVIREQASNLLARIDPSVSLPALVGLLYSSDDRVKRSAATTFVAVLNYHGQEPGVICMLLDCLSNLNQSRDLPNATGDVWKESNRDADPVLKLIPEWSKTVQDWKPFVAALTEKMFADPGNATIVRFMSCLSDRLAEVADVVLYSVLLQMQRQEVDESLVSQRERGSYTNQDSVKQQSLFDRLCPLLIIRMLPLKVFDDLNLSVMYGQLLNQWVILGCGDIKADQECISAFLVKRALNESEFEDVRKLAAELCGRIHPQVLLPAVTSVLEHATVLHDTLKIKACLFSLCTSLVVRGGESFPHSALLKIRQVLEKILRWPPLDNNEVSKAQRGCIDCLALIICAELEGPGSDIESRRRKFSGKADTETSIFNYVIHQLITNEEEVENSAYEANISRSFRICMANVLISACHKVSDSNKESLAQKALLHLIPSVKGIRYPEIRSACVQVLFSAVYHLKSAVLPYSADLLKLSLELLQDGSEKERLGGAKLMASLMASEDEILETISVGLIEARSVLSNVSRSDLSLEIRQICKQLLACITT